LGFGKNVGSYLSYCIAGEQIYPCNLTVSFYQLGWVHIRILEKLVNKSPVSYTYVKEMGRAEDSRCVCDGWTSQNAAHLQRCPWVGDGMGAVTGTDERWCEQVVEFVL